jgi:4'-phosphopantetheinyl transferase
LCKGLYDWYLTGGVVLNNQFLPAKKSAVTCLDLLRADTNHTAAISCCRMSLPQLIGSKDSFLSAAENHYFEQLKAQRRQHSYLLGRFAAKQAIIKKVPYIDAQDIHIASGVFTQPVIEHPQIHNLLISISHTKDYAMAVSFPEHYPMGIDIESVQRTNEQAISRHVSLEEINIFKAFPYNEQQILTLLWSIKEALSKSFKTGLMADFSLFDVASAEKQKNLIISHFKYWHQYQAISTIVGNLAFAVVLPKKTNINLSEVIGNLQLLTTPTDKSMEF